MPVLISTYFPVLAGRHSDLEWQKNYQIQIQFAFIVTSFWLSVCQAGYIFKNIGWIMPSKMAKDKSLISFNFWEVAHFFFCYLWDLTNWCGWWLTFWLLRCSYVMWRNNRIITGGVGEGGMEQGQGTKMREKLSGNPSLWFEFRVSIYMCVYSTYYSVTQPVTQSFTQLLQVSHFSVVSFYCFYSPLTTFCLFQINEYKLYKKKPFLTFLI